MTDYDLQKPELIELCRKRGLPTSGTKEDLIARLAAQDEQQNEPDLSDDELDSDTPDPEPTGEGEVVMVGDDSGTQANPLPSELVQADRSEPEGTDAPTGGSEGHGGAPEGHDDPSARRGSSGIVGDELPVVNEPIRAYRVELSFEGELDDNQHRRLLQACHDAAIAAGHQTKGYPYAGHRLSIGQNTAVYEVAVRRKD